MVRRRVESAQGTAGEPTPRPPARPAETFVDAAGQPLPDADARVLRAFVRDGRLRSIPARAKKREVVLRYLLERCFPEARMYPEKEVNQRLALVHPDVAALRRQLVDSGLMTRIAGEYRRAMPATSGDGARRIG